MLASEHAHGIINGALHYEALQRVAGGHDSISPQLRLFEGLAEEGNERCQSTILPGQHDTMFILDSLIA